MREEDVIVGIGCYGGCANTVIGQCQGHRRGCGRFYCSEHNADRLCYECGADLSRDLEAESRYPGYVAASVRLATADQTRRSRQRATVLTGVLFAVALVVAVGNIGTPRVPERAVTGAAWVLFGLGAVSAFLWWRAYEWGRYLRDRCDDEPGLAQFAVLWERQWRDRTSEHQDPRDRERLVGLISAALINPARRDDRLSPVDTPPTDVLGQQPA